MGSFKDKLKGIVLVSLAATLLSLPARESSLIKRLENVLWDWRVQFSARPQQADQRIKLIVIDQGSLDYFDKEQSITWPWPRPVYIPVIKFLERAGARVLAFDLLFTESSVSGVEDDRQFAAALASKLPVVVAASLSSADREVDADKEELFAARQDEFDQRTNFAQRYLDFPEVSRFTSATLPLLDLLKNSAAIGIVNAAPDRDGIFRHYKPGAFFKNIPALGLPFAMRELTNANSNNELILRDFLDNNGRLTLKFHGPSNTYQSYNIVNIIQSEIALENGQKPDIAPEQFADAWVLLGVWAPGLLDLRPTSLDQVYRGVEFNATVLDNLLHGNFIKSSASSTNILTHVFFVVLASALTELASSALLQALLNLAVVGSLLMLGFVLAAAGVWLPLAAPLLGVILASFGAGLYKYQSEGKQRRFLKGAFSRYVSPAVIEQIIKNPSTLSLGGERRELSIFFSDIEGFTSISEKLSADKLVQLLNTFLSAMTDIILQEGGTLDKYIGDAIVAFWNAPLPVEDHAQRAVRAGLRCQEKLAEMQAYFSKEFNCTIKMRIGIHTGSVTVGNVGSKDRFNYTMIGDAANLASRLEGANKYFGTYCLISESTYRQLAGAITARELATVRVLGKEQALKIYEPLSAEKSVSRDTQNAKFELARELFERCELAQALEQFKALADDPAAVKYVERINSEIRLQTGSAGFSAVWSLTAK